MTDFLSDFYNRFFDRFFDRFVNSFGGNHVSKYIKKGNLPKRLRTTELRHFFRTFDMTRPLAGQDLVQRGPGQIPC